MKKHAVAFLLAIIAAGNGGAQGIRVLELQGGYFDPKGTAAGLIFGGNYGITVDERVDLSLGVSYFHRGYAKETEVATEVSQSGVVEKTHVLNLEYSTTLLPLLANVTVRIPFGRPVSLYAGGSLCYQFLFNKETNYEEGASRKQRYRAAGWMARAGADYQIGSRSSLTVEAFYNGTKVKANTAKKEGLPVWDEVDVSGVGLRAGLRMELY